MIFPDLGGSASSFICAVFGDKAESVLADLQAAFPYDFPDTRAAADLAVLLAEQDDAERKRRPKGCFPDPTVVDWSQLAADIQGAGNLLSLLSYHLQDAGNHLLLRQRTTLYLEALQPCTLKPYNLVPYSLTTLYFEEQAILAC